MTRTVRTAGVQVDVECAVTWVGRLIEAACGDALTPGTGRGSALVRVEAERGAFPTAGWELVTRGAWRRPGQVVVENVAASGFDLALAIEPSRPVFAFRWRPPLRERLASAALRHRFVLLARAALLHYPALWWAGVLGRYPLHAAVCTAGPAVPLLAGPGGVGKSTLLAAEIAAGGRVVSDNVCVSDGRSAWGLVEPLRIAAGGGRRTTHGRVETAIGGRLPCLEPDRVVVVRRGKGDVARCGPCRAGDAARSLVTGTYVAGELRRYWPVAAVLSEATGLGPAHPRVEEVAVALAGRLPCFELALPSRPPRTPVRLPEWEGAA
jgi:hypothetical protein